MFFTGMSSTSKDYMDVFVIKKKKIWLNVCNPVNFDFVAVTVEFSVHKETSHSGKPYSC